MLTEEQIEKIASNLNEKIDLPFMGEEKEQEILESVVSSIGDKLESVIGELPEPIQKIWDRLSDGVDDEDAEALIQQLSDEINNHIDIPLLSEEKEAELVIIPVTRMIVDTLRSE